MTLSIPDGQILEDKYEILRKIGQGGMGVVYEARHVDLKVTVAIKVLHPREADDPNMLARFRAEAQSLASIKHPNVVDVTDFGLTPDRRPFFVMEYLAGESLADRLDRLGSFNERMVVEVADQMLDGLRSAHRKGIIHRDLKPENVLLSKTDDGREIVKILDFGIAKILGGNVTHPSRVIDDRPQTQQGIVLGTPGYIAPEAVTGAGKIDNRADLFSLGVILFEMLCGRRPFVGSTPHQTMMATATKPVPRPTSIRAEISEAMERLVLTSLAKDPFERFQTADEFAHHLTAAAVGRVPSDARNCKTRVGLPSVVPSSPAKRLDSIEVPLDKRELPPSRPRPVPRYKGPARRRRLVFPVSPWAVLFVLALAGAAYYLFFHEKPFRTIDHDDKLTISDRSSLKERIHDPKYDTNSPAVSATEIEKISLWLDLFPRNARVEIDGTLTTLRPVVVPISEESFEMTVSAPGYRTRIMSVTPDREKTVKIRLKLRKKKN